jgi:hypothetical protein
LKLLPLDIGAERAHRSMFMLMAAKPLRPSPTKGEILSILYLIGWQPIQRR